MTDSDVDDDDNDNDGAQYECSSVTKIHYIVVILCVFVTKCGVLAKVKF
jgi:hypothetical protein